MSDLDKIDKLEKAIKFVKENSVVVGFLLAAVPIIGGAFYTGITELNKAKDALSQFVTIEESYGLSDETLYIFDFDNTLLTLPNNLKDSLANLFFF